MADGMVYRINGANIFWPEQFGVGSNSRYDTLIVGLVNAAPYFACFTVGISRERLYVSNNQFLPVRMLDHRSVESNVRS